MKNSTAKINEQTLQDSTEFIQFTKDNVQQLEQFGITSLGLKNLATMVYKLINPSNVYSSIFRSKHNETSISESNAVVQKFIYSLTYLICQVRLHPQLNLSQMVYETPATNELYKRICKIFVSWEYRQKLIINVQKGNSNRLHSLSMQESTSQYTQQLDVEQQFYQFIDDNEKLLNEAGVDSHTMNFVGNLSTNCQYVDLLDKFPDHKNPLIKEFASKLQKIVKSHNVGSTFSCYHDQIVYQNIAAQFNKFPISKVRKEQYQEYYSNLEEDQKTQRINSKQLTIGSNEKQYKSDSQILEYHQLLSNSQNQLNRSRQQNELSLQQLQISKSLIRKQEKIFQQQEKHKRIEDYWIQGEADKTRISNLTAPFRSPSSLRNDDGAAFQAAVSRTLIMNEEIDKTKANIISITRKQ